MTMTMQTWKEILSKLGYEVEPQGNKLYLNRSNRTYKMVVVEADNNGYIYLMVDNISKKDNTFFNSDAQCICIKQNTDEGQDLIIFRLDHVHDLIKPIIKQKHQDKKFAFHETTQDVDKMHVRYDYDFDGYDIYMFIPVNYLCNNLKHKREKIGKLYE